MDSPGDSLMSGNLAAPVLSCPRSGLRSVQNLQLLPESVQEGEGTDLDLSAGSLRMMFEDEGI